MTTVMDFQCVLPALKTVRVAISQQLMALNATNAVPTISLTNQVTASLLVSANLVNISTGLIINAYLAPMDALIALHALTVHHAHPHLLIIQLMLLVLAIAHKQALSGMVLHAKVSIMR
jgi:hypothetical protein